MENNVIVIYGVSGSGKSTIAQCLAKELGIPYYDADDYHPQENIDKMSQGHPLNDSDRLPWLIHLSSQMEIWVKNGNAILACSALKNSYREILSSSQVSIQWIHLKGDIELIKNRMKNRTDHFMKSQMLQSQFDAFERANYGLHIQIENTPEEITKSILKIIKKKILQSTFGVIGLGVMGKSLSLNIAEKGHQLSVYNRASEGEEHIVSEFLNSNPEFQNISGHTDLETFVNSISIPRKILLMIKAGSVVNHVLRELIPLLNSGDTVIDGGNSHYEDTRQRHKLLESHNIHFIGCGISGGEEGARHGPSIMPGGPKESYGLVTPVLESISAKDINGNPCCTYIGPDGSGHFVKMIHNGIEYAEMQLLAETYDLLKGQYSYEEMADIFSKWNKTHHASYLLEITIDILRKKENGEYLIDLILDKAGNKGTGSWSSKAAFDLGSSNTMMADAVFARYISSYKSTRETLSKKLKTQSTNHRNLKEETLSEAYHFVRLINHHQGFEVMSRASEQYDWHLNFSKIASVWTNGCIIRSTFMQDAIQRFESKSSLLEHDDILHQLHQLESSVKEVISHGLDSRIPTPIISSAYQYWVAMTTDRLPANVLQAQRDYFGAHTYKRIDQPESNSYHTNWK